MYILTKTAEVDGTAADVGVMHIQARQTSLFAPELRFMRQRQAVNEAGLAGASTRWPPLQPTGETGATGTSHAATQEHWPRMGYSARHFRSKWIRR